MLDRAQYGARHVLDARASYGRDAYGLLVEAHNCAVGSRSVGRVLLLGGGVGVRVGGRVARLLPHEIEQEQVDPGVLEQLDLVVDAYVLEVDGLARPVDHHEAALLEQAAADLARVRGAHVDANRTDGLEQARLRALVHQVARYETLQLLGHGDGRHVVVGVVVVGYRFALDRRDRRFVA